jgi:hypothetical protein
MTLYDAGHKEVAAGEMLLVVALASTWEAVPERTSCRNIVAMSTPEVLVDGRSFVPFASKSS